MVAKLHQEARFVRDAKGIIGELTVKKVTPSFCGSVHDPTGPAGRLLFDILAIVAKSNLGSIRTRTRESVQVTKTKGTAEGFGYSFSRPRLRSLWS